MYALVHVYFGRSCKGIAEMAAALAKCGIREITYHLIKYDIIAIKLPAFYKRRKIVERIRNLKLWGQSATFVQSVNLAETINSAQWWSYRGTPPWSRKTVMHNDIVCSLICHKYSINCLLQRIWKQFFL